MTQEVIPQFTTRAGDLVTAGLPLREFIGTLADIIPQLGAQRKYAELPHTEVEVIEADPGVVWPHPIAQLDLTAFFDSAGRPRQFGPYSDFLTSVEALGYTDAMTLIGHQLHWKATMRPYESNRDRNPCTGNEYEGGMCTTCGLNLESPRPHGQLAMGKDWTVVEVDGSGEVSGGSIQSNGLVGEEGLLAILASPKTATEFAQAVVADPGLKVQYGNQSLFDGHVLAGLVASGKVHMTDADHYQVVTE